MKLIVYGCLAIVLLMLPGCITWKNTEVNFYNTPDELSYVEQDFKVEGFTLESTTDQKSDGTLDANVGLKE